MRPCGYSFGVSAVPPGTQARGTRLPAVWHCRGGPPQGAALPRPPDRAHRAPAGLPRHRGAPLPVPGLRPDLRGSPPFARAAVCYTRKLMEFVSRLSRVITIPDAADLAELGWNAPNRTVKRRLPRDHGWAEFRVLIDALGFAEEVASTPVRLRHPLTARAAAGQHPDGEPQPSLRDAGSNEARHPMLKHWAYLSGPSGTRTRVGPELAVRSQTLDGWRGSKPHGVAGRRAPLSWAASEAVRGPKKPRKTTIKPLLTPRDGRKIIAKM